MLIVFVFVKHVLISYGVIAGASRDKLGMCKGTILEKPLKQYGHIDFDIVDRTHSVKVFFVPAVAKLMGSRFKGARVQFRLGFTVHDGYEAYHVSYCMKTKLSVYFSDSTLSLNIHSCSLCSCAANPMVWFRNQIALSFLL